MFCLWLIVAIIWFILSIVAVGILCALEDPPGSFEPVAFVIIVGVFGGAFWPIIFAIAAIALPCYIPYWIGKKIGAKIK